MGKEEIDELSTALAELILQACEHSKHGEIDAKRLKKLIKNFLNNYYGEQHS